MSHVVRPRAAQQPTTLPDGLRREAGRRLMAHSRVAFAVAVTLERLPLLPLVARNVERVAAQCGSAAVVIVRDHEATDAKVARAWRRGAPQAATGVHVLAQRPCAQGEQRAGRMEKIAAVRNTYWDFLFSTGFNESHTVSGSGGLCGGGGLGHVPPVGARWVCCRLRSAAAVGRGALQRHRAAGHALRLLVHRPPRAAGAARHARAVDTPRRHPHHIAGASELQGDPPRHSSL